MYEQALIRLERLTRVFHAEDVDTYSLFEVDIEIGQGEYVAIEGPSGSGKSTLLSILGMLDVPTSGEYFLDGRAVAFLPAVERALVRNRQIGFVFQQFNLISALTVYENVDLPLTFRSMSASERRARVTSSLERVGILHRRDHYPSQLSGGQQQRVAVARAVAGDPVILLADEPTGNLDSANATAVMELLRQQHRNGTTICLVTHDARFAAHAERSIRLLDGKVVEDFAPSTPMAGRPDRSLEVGG